MRGDARVRHCTHCDRKVYNLSDMSDGEARAFLRENEGRECVRFYQRRDGTLMTRDCGRAERTVVRAKAAVVGLLGLFGIVFASPVYAGASSSPRTVMNGYLRRVQSLTEQIRTEKDPEVRQMLVEMREEASRKAKEAAERVREREG
jgi:hypothetical protein